MSKCLKNILRFIWLFIFLIIFLVLVCNFLEKTKTYQKLDYYDIPRPSVNETRVSLVMIGDALIHSSIYADAKKGNTYDFKPMFSEIKSLLSSYDLKFYNQETILGGSSLGLSNYPQFNSPYEVGDAFIDMGFNLVSLATNHTLDRGYGTNYKTIINSRNYWDNKTNVIAAGSYISEEQREKIVVQEKNGIKYGLLAYTTLTNGLKSPTGKEFYLNVYDKETVKKDIEKIRDKVDLLIVSMHWGIEYSHDVSNSQKEIAKYLSSLGVNIIIGTHPHVVEPIEFIDDTLVVYSLGNFISSQIGVEKLTGLIVDTNIVKTTIDDKVYIKVEEPKADLVYTCKASVCGHFKVYPYNNLNNKILNNYDSYFDKYMSIVRKYDSNIQTIYSKK
ncbi:MAG: CapA family protein [bacterium]|nr:CapA family protein [bacterium]